MTIAGVFVGCVYARAAGEWGWHSHTWQLACVLQPFLKRLNYGDDSYQLFMRAREAARALGDRRAESLALHGMGLVCRHRGPNDLAKVLCAEALQLSSEDGSTQYQAYQRNDLAIMYLNDGDIEAAHGHFTAAHLAAISDGDQELTSFVKINLGFVSAELGRFEEAFGYLRPDGKLLQVSSSQANVYLISNLGLLLHRSGDSRSAIEQFQHSLQISRRLQLWEGQTEGLIGLCRAYRSVGRLGDALKFGREALELARRYGSDQAEVDALNCLGDAFIALRDHDAAVRLYADARRVSADRGMRCHQARSLSGLGHAYLARGMTAEARSHWRAALETYPAGHVEALGVRQHLDSMDGGGTTCSRCVTDPAARPTLPSPARS